MHLFDIVQLLHWKKRIILVVSFVDSILKISESVQTAVNTATSSTSTLGLGLQSPEFVHCIGPFFAETPQKNTTHQKLGTTHKYFPFRK